MKAEIAKKSAQLASKEIVTDSKKSFKRSELYKRGYNGVNFVEDHTDFKRHKNSSNLVYKIDKDYVPTVVNVADDDIAKSMLEKDSKVRNYVEGKARMMKKRGKR